MGVSTPILQRETESSRAVRRGCNLTHTVREETLRAVRRGCDLTHTVREETLRTVRRGCVINHTFLRGRIVFLHAVRRGFGNMHPCYFETPVKKYECGQTHKVRRGEFTIQEP